MFAESGRGVKRGREQDNDPMLDRHGNPATPKLFVNRLPPSIQEPEVVDLFSKYDGFVSVHLGNKELMPGEYRTCVVSYNSAEQAAAARTGLQHHQATGWSNPMLINFVKQDTRDAHQHPANHLLYNYNNAAIDDATTERDGIGNLACPTIFIKNFSPNLSVEKMETMFPNAAKIMPGNKQLRPGEFRTAYISFEDTASAIAARKSMTGFTDNEQTVPLVINYSVRPQDQVKTAGVVGASPTGYLPTFPSVPSPIVHAQSPFSAAQSPFSVQSPFSAALSTLHHYNTTAAAAAAAAASIPQGAATPITLSPAGLSALGHYAAAAGLTGMYGGAAAAGYPPASLGYGDPYSRGMNPFHVAAAAARLGAVSPAEERYSLTDLFDTKGNPASNGLFVDCLPYDIRENQIHAIFSHSPGFKGLHMGNKVLSPNEYRTAIIHFSSTENALRARSKLQYYRETGWNRPLIIHYVKH